MMRSIVPAGFILLSAFWTPGAEADIGTDQVRTVPALTARPAVLSVHMDAHRLGIAESMLKYCTRVDPPDATTLRKRIAHMWQSASEPQVVRVRNSTEYRSAYAAVTDFVTKVDEHNARQACREWLTANK